MPVKIKTELGHKIRAAQYLKKTYPFLTFRTSFFDDLQMDERTSGRYFQLQSGKSFPDMQFFKPIGRFHGLLIEAKATKEDLFMSDGCTLRNDHHIQAQAAEMRKLTAEGWCCKFAIGERGIIETVEKYLAAEF